MSKADTITRLQFKNQEAKDTLEKGLAKAQKLWSERKSNDDLPYIVGVLEGTIKLALQDLQE
jgi:hypothetical protein